MAVIHIGNINLSYPEAKDLGVKTLIDPVIISRGMYGHFLVNLRLVFEGNPEVVAECHDLANKDVWYAPLPITVFRQVVEETREKHVVGLVQPHLATTLARWVVTGRFDPEAAETQLLSKIA